jgi:hypothetical protein
MPQLVGERSQAAVLGFEPCRRAAEVKHNLINLPASEYDADYGADYAGHGLLHVAVLGEDTNVFSLVRPFKGDRHQLQVEHYDVNLAVRDDEGAL